MFSSFSPATHQDSHPITTHSPFNFSFLVRLKWHVYENIASVKLDKPNIRIFLGFLSINSSVKELEMLYWVIRAGERLQPPKLLSGSQCSIAKNIDLNKTDCTCGVDPCPSFSLPSRTAFPSCSQDEVCGRYNHYT